MEELSKVGETNLDTIQENFKVESMFRNKVFAKIFVFVNSRHFTSQCFFKFSEVLRTPLHAYLTTSICYNMKRGN